MKWPVVPGSIKSWGSLATLGISKIWLEAAIFRSDGPVVCLKVSS